MGWWFKKRKEKKKGSSYSVCGGQERRELRKKKRSSLSFAHWHYRRYHPAVYRGGVCTHTAIGQLDLRRRWGAGACARRLLLLLDTHLRCVCVCVFDDTPVGHGCWMFVLLLVGAKWAYSSFFAGQKHTHKRHGRSLYYFIQSLFFSFAIDSMMTTARVHQLQPPGARPHLRRREDKSYCASHNKKYLVVPCCWGRVFPGWCICCTDWGCLFWHFN